MQDYVDGYFTLSADKELVMAFIFGENIYERSKVPLGIPRFAGIRRWVLYKDKYDDRYDVAFS